MIASSWWKVALGVVGVAGVLATSGTGCGSGTSGATSTSAGGGTSGTGGSTAGTGGDATTAGTTTTTTSGTTTSTAGSTTASTGTGTSAYADCTECADIAAGAPANECKASHVACVGDPNCVQILDCVSDPNNGCGMDPSAACCVYDCYNQLKATLGNDAVALQKAIDEYHAYDDCLLCTTCKTLCTTDGYCAAYAAGPAACGG